MIYTQKALQGFIYKYITWHILNKFDIILYLRIFSNIKSGHFYLKVNEKETYM